MTAVVQSEARSPSRRALLAGALGGLGTLAAAAIGRPQVVRANDPNDVVLGANNTSTATTKISNTTTGASVLWGASDSGEGVVGTSSTNTGVVGISTFSTGVRGSSTSGKGVYGLSSANPGVHGSSTSGYGVWGESSSNNGVIGSSSEYVGVYGLSTSYIGVFGISGPSYGVAGHSESGPGVYGFSTSNSGVYGLSDSSIGIQGDSTAPDQAASLGRSSGNSSGVQGYSGPNPAPAAKAKTGVFGYANQDSSSKGIYGESSKGYAGYFAGRVYTSSFHEMIEISAPAAPGTNKARLFLKDSGGKTQLCVRFNTGAIKVLATQP